MATIATMAAMATMATATMARVVPHPVLCSCTLALTRGGLQLRARVIRVPRHFLVS